MRVSRRAWRVAAVVWAATILVTSVLPTRDAVDAVSGGHAGAATLAGHFAAYALLGFLLGVGLGGWEVRRERVAPAFVLAVALGAVVELIQGPLPYRDAQWLDVAVNSAGAAAGLLVFSAVARGRRRRARRG